jgi:hypothetical protein
MPAAEVPTVLRRHAPENFYPSVDMLDHDTPPDKASVIRLFLPAQRMILA